jgi:protein tyrosine phosphatase type 4A
VHCVAGMHGVRIPFASSDLVRLCVGLGRAPVLVAVALIEAGMSPLDAIEFVRRRRRGGK